MKKNIRKEKQAGPVRSESRFSQLSELHITYEGRGGSVQIHPPDISSRGMFVSTSTHYPEGAVVILRFRLTRSNIEVQTRAEVRYCLAGIGIGVEFIGIDLEDRHAIEEEIRFSSRSRPRRRLQNP